MGDMLFSIGAEYQHLSGFGLGLVILLIGGYWLIPASVSLATRVHLPPRLIASVIIAGGTSAPELLVSVNAGLTGNPDIALANVTGSNITNIFLVFGLGILLMPVGLNSPRDRQDIFWLTILTLAVSVMLLADIFASWGGRMIGLCLIASFFLLALRQKKADNLPPETSGSPQFGLMASVVMTLLSIAALITGAHLMVTHAVSIATSFEIDKAVIGATIVAIGTSLPEITAVMASLLKGRQDMAVGNIIGSNMFNICIVLGITAMAAPLPASPSLLFTILPFFVLSSLFLLGLSWRFSHAGRRVGTAFLGIYGCFAGLCYVL